MKQFKKMSSGEFAKQKIEASKEKFSPFARFCLSSSGYEYYTQTGEIIDKWEVFFIFEYRNINQILEKNEIIISLKNDKK